MITNVEKTLKRMGYRKVKGGWIKPFANILLKVTISLTELTMDSLFIAADNGSYCLFATRNCYVEDVEVSMIQFMEGQVSTFSRFTSSEKLVPELSLSEMFD